MLCDCLVTITEAGTVFFNVAVVVGAAVAAVVTVAVAAALAF